MASHGKRYYDMSNKILIASDSTCDLSPELIAEYGIAIIPLGVTLGERQYTDGVDIDPDFIYAHYEKTGELPKTSAVNLTVFEDFFKEHTADGQSVILFTISSEMSSTYRNAEIAAEGVPGAYAVDTRNLSTGGGLLVLAAAEMAKAGMSAPEIVEKCRELTACVRALSRRTPELKKTDEVAYVRFASVYRQFKDINTFMAELSKLLEDK